MCADTGAEDIVREDAANASSELCRAGSLARIEDDREDTLALVRVWHAKRAMLALGGHAVVKHGAPWMPAYLASGSAADEAEGADLDEMFSFFSLTPRRANIH